MPKVSKECLANAPAHVRRLYVDREVRLAAASATEIAQALGVRRKLVYDRAAALGVKLPRHQPPRVETTEPRPGDPSQETIAARAAQVRARWTAKERARRFVGDLPGPWEPAVYSERILDR